MNRMPDERRRALVTLDISSTREIYSAQQKMRVVVISRIRLRRLDRRDSDCGDGVLHLRCGDAQGMSLSFPICWSCPAEATDRSGGSYPPPAFVRILCALRRGKNRLVLREWMRGACWWNLNTNRDYVESECTGPVILRGSYHRVHDASDADTICRGKSAAVQSTLSMARAEVAGYRLARLALDYDHGFKPFSVSYSGENSVSVANGDKHQSEEHHQMMDKLSEYDSLRPNHARIYVPEVLFFSHDDFECDTPWALLSYFENKVSDEIKILPQHLEVEIDDKSCGNQLIDGLQCDDMHPIMNSTTMLPCYHFPSTMVKIRHEFGFDEPHPRHGRVRADECLDYAMMILRDVIMPVQGYFFSLWPDSTYDKQMIGNLLSIGCFNSKQANQMVTPFQYQDMIVVYRHALNRLSKANTGPEEERKNDGRIIFLLRMLDECINALSCEWEKTGGRPPPLPPVLCHMDLQPQNLAFERDHDRNCFVASVMDWEEACFADPRFELLLICRKVLANREQAETMWQSYSVFVQQCNSLLSLKTEMNIHWTIGGIEPWLKLETVHSLCTLSMQAMDLIGVGRSPWETKLNLWGKIARERQRLVHMGWIFCDYDGP
ncbi:hypothetical protein ACHAW5_009391 [Stephanodiscus triporus]|uniref:Aminoglycoside phosphotransferase domain-containing protein n=1 Tax=Stephanodiscus triporus TaxID=2934178 RepID=A0ABD3PK39_9STRA